MNVMQQERVRTALLSLDGIGGAMSGRDSAGVDWDFGVYEVNGDIALDTEERPDDDDDGLGLGGCCCSGYTLTPSDALNLAVALLRVLAAMESEVAL